MRESKQYLIIKDNNPRQVWNYIEQKWAWQIDGVYNDERDGFVYNCKKSASHRLKILKHNWNEDHKNIGELTANIITVKDHADMLQNSYISYR